LYNYLFIVKRIHLSDQSLGVSFTEACIHMHALICVFIDVCMHARLYIVTRDHVMLFLSCMFSVATVVGGEK